MNILWQGLVFQLPKRLTLLACLSVLLLAAAPQSVFPPLQVAHAQGPEVDDTAPVISVDLNATRGKSDARSFGVIMGNKGHDIAEQNYFYQTNAGKQDLVNLGVKSLYYWADRDDWQNPYNPFTAEPATPDQVLDTNEFLHLNIDIGTDPMIAVNITNLCERANPNLPYSSSNVQCEMATPDIAKSWLQYIKSTGIRDVKYVFLGVEPYSGCDYWKDGINCTTNKGEHKISLTQDEYAKRVASWAKALRQVDSKIKLGLQLQPNTYICETKCTASWDETVLKKVGSMVDFVVTHQYFVVETMPATESAAQRFSYYQEQTDYRVEKQGVTAMPKQIRKELLKWLPAKANMPIFTGEFNAGRTDNVSNADSINTRMSLYSGMSLAEGYLDSISPVNYKKVLYKGVSRLILLDLYSLPVMLAHYLPLDTPTTLVKAPGWQMLSALKDIQGKTWVTTKIKNNPGTPVGRPALRAYSLKKNKDVWIVVMNHSADTAITSNINLVGTTPVSATATVIGDTATGFLAQNTPANPNAIGPTTTAIPSGQIKSDHLENINFPAHSMTVIKVVGN